MRSVTGMQAQVRNRRLPLGLLFEQSGRTFKRLGDDSGDRQELGRHLPTATPVDRRSL
jgi:hypothetical protein